MQWSEVDSRLKKDRYIATSKKWTNDEWMNESAKGISKFFVH